MLAVKGSHRTVAAFRIRYLLDIQLEVDSGPGLFQTASAVDVLEFGHYESGEDQGNVRHVTICQLGDCGKTLVCCPKRRSIA